MSFSPNSNQPKKVYIASDLCRKDDKYKLKDDKYKFIYFFVAEKAGC